MSSLRDARLQKALENAPDAHERPPEAVRAAIGDFARRAVAPSIAASATTPVTVPWWRRLGTSASGSRMPWNGAFATLLLAGVVTLIWRDEQVPGARSDAPEVASRDAPAVPAPAPAVPAAPAQAPAAIPAPAPAPGPAATPAAGADARAARENARAAQEQRAKAESAPAKARQEAERAAREKMDAAPPPRMEAGMSAPPAAAAPPQAVAVPAPAPAPQAAPAGPRLEDSTVRSRTAPAPAAAPQMQAPPPAALPSAWSRLMVSSGDRLAVVQQGEKPALAAALQRAAAATAREPFSGVPVASIGIAGDSGVIGILEASETHVRWTPRAPGAPAAFEGRPAQRQMNELLAAVREAVPR